MGGVQHRGKPFCLADCFRHELLFKLVSCDCGARSCGNQITRTLAGLHPCRLLLGAWAQVKSSRTTTTPRP
jgi:hypothetical protein